MGFRKFNLPFDYVHDIDISYGWILFPWFGGCWIGLRQKCRRYIGHENGYQLRKFKRFHNCTATRFGK